MSFNDLPFVYCYFLFINNFMFLTDNFPWIICPLGVQKWEDLPWPSHLQQNIIWAESEKVKQKLSNFPHPAFELQGMIAVLVHAQDHTAPTKIPSHHKFFPENQQPNCVFYWPNSSSWSCMIFKEYFMKFPNL